MSHGVRSEDGPKGAGDEVVLRIRGHRAIVAHTPDFLTLAGTTLKVPRSLRRLAWDDIIRTLEQRGLPSTVERVRRQWADDRQAL